MQVKDNFPLDPKAPRTQLALRYTAKESSDRNDIQIMQSSFSSPIGGDPLQAEGIRLTCTLELAVGAGALRLTSTDPSVQPHLDYRYLEDSWDRQRLREAVRLCARLLQHEAYQGIVQEQLAPSDQEAVVDQYCRRSHIMLGKLQSLGKQVDLANVNASKCILQPLKSDGYDDGGLTEPAGFTVYLEYERLYDGSR